ncbi:MAG: hypothetical protein II896_05590 [Clostridia bacterium]|nr:hypothetical protein [Clostridia bacterium]
MKKWTLTSKKKLIVTLVCAVLAGLLGYVETLIPPLFPTVPYLRVQLGVLFAAFLLVCYSPAEAAIAFGVRSIVYGLVLDDGLAIVFELAAFTAASVAAWGLLKTRRFSALPIGAALGVAYAFVYTCLIAINVHRGAPFALIAETMTFYLVDYLVLGVGAWLALRYVPPKILFDENAV